MLQRPQGTEFSSASLATQFIVHVQTAQEQSGKKLVGKISIDPQKFEAILQFLSTDPQIKSYSTEITGIAHAFEKLLVKFEVMCQRRSISSPKAPLREHVYSRLCQDLYHNTRFFGHSPEILVSPTLLTPVALIEALSSQPLSWFKEKHPGMILRAFYANPGNPVKFLQETLNRMQQIKVHLKQSAKELPASTQLRLATASHATKPEELVNAHFALINQIHLEPEFSDFYRKKAYAVDHAVNNYGEKGARDFLRHIKSVFQAILADKNFASLYDNPGTIMFAAIHNPEHTTEFLEGMLARENRIKELTAILKRDIGKKALRDLCLKTPLRAKELEMSLLNEITSM